MDSSLEKINDAVLTESVFGRIFGFGDLEIQTASESGIDRLRMLRDAPGFKRAMLDSKHDLELELSGAKPMPAPAYRAPTTPAAAASSIADAPTGSLAAPRHRSPRCTGREPDVGRRGHPDAGEPGRPPRSGRDQRRGVRGEEGGPAEPPLIVVADAAIGPRGPTDR